MAGNPTAEAAEAPEPAQGPLYAPLMIALCIIVSAAMTLSAIHFFLTQLCRRRRQRSNSSPSGKKTTGVNRKLLKSIPIYAYSKNMSNCRLEQRECSVCLSEFYEGEAIRCLPNCGHIFHVVCVDAWFELHPTCPFCRTVATPPQPPVAPINNSEGPTCPLPWDIERGHYQDGMSQQRMYGLPWPFGYNLMAFLDKLRPQRSEEVTSAT